MTNKSLLFTVYNLQRAQARTYGWEIGRINRALGLAQSKLPDAYGASDEGCTCADFKYRGGPASTSSLRPSAA